MVDASTVVCGSGVSVGGMVVGGMDVGGTGEFVATGAGVDGKLQATRIVTVSKVNILRINGFFSENRN